MNKMGVLIDSSLQDRRMETILRLFVFALGVLSTSAEPCRYSNLKMVDLTHVISPDTVFWPGSPDFNFTILHRGIRDPPGTFWLENNFFATSEHGGTHFDAPAHLYKGAWRSHQIPIQQLAGPGVVLDVRDKVATNPDYEVTIQDLEDWESRNGRIPYGFVVVMNSGWDKKYPNKTAVFGSNNSLDSSTFHFPGFSPAACEWLVHNRNIHVIGVDTPSLDYGQSTDGLSHVIISKVNIVILENVAYLGTIPEAGIIIFFGAMKVYDGSGVPARVFALVSEDKKNKDRCIFT